MSLIASDGKVAIKIGKSGSKILYFDFLSNILYNDINPTPRLNQSCRLLSFKNTGSNYFSTKTDFYT